MFYFLSVELTLTVCAVLAGVTHGCLSDFTGQSKNKVNRSILLDVPVDNGVVTFQWDCAPRESLLRYELVIEMLRIIDPKEDDDGHGHSRGNLPRVAQLRRLIDRSEQVLRSRYIIVKYISPTACEYRSDELQTNSIYSVFLLAVNNNEEPFACSNNQTFHTSARVIQHMVVTTEVLISMGLVFLLWLCAVGAFLRQWKFVQLSTPYEATRHYKPQNVDQIRIINREEDGIIYRHSNVNPARRTTSVGCTSSSEHSTVRIQDDVNKPPSARPGNEIAGEQVAQAAKNGVQYQKNRVPKKDRSMPCVKVTELLEPLIATTQSQEIEPTNEQQHHCIDVSPNELVKPSQQLTVLTAADILSKAKSAPNIFITDVGTAS